jgi:glycosyltransferase involved in cell wall biosynthesis
VKQIILYVTMDGVLQPLGYSQVFRVVHGLAQRGIRYHLLSLERKRDWENQARRCEVRSKLQEFGAEWTSFLYDEQGGGRAALNNLGRLIQAISGILRTGDVGLIHARGYQATIAAWSLRPVFHVPYLFDARGYWIDENAEEGRWFDSSLAYQVGKGIERQLFHHASAVVTLTDIQKQDLLAGVCGSWGKVPIEVVPTCADFDEFRAEPALKTNHSLDFSAEYQQIFHGKQLVGLIGSINTSYYNYESILLCKYYLEESPQGHLVIMTNQKEQFADMLAQAKIPMARTTIVSVPHSSMPSWMAHLTWCPLLLRKNFAKRASVPTKLGELFASGVRPVAYGCNSEILEWVTRAGTGIVLDSVDDSSLRSVARWMAENQISEQNLMDAREKARQHFGLEQGLDRYQQLLKTVLELQSLLLFEMEKLYFPNFSAS